MPRQEDLEGGRAVRKEFARRPIDMTRAQVHISHGIVRISGQVRAMRGHAMDLKSEMELIARVLKQKPGIRDVILECIFRD